MAEEQNRICADHLSDFLFCPTQTGVDNLAKEGIQDGVFNVGDIMFDAHLFYSQKIGNTKCTIFNNLILQNELNFI